MAAISLLGALAIGVAGILTVSVWLAPFVLAGALFLPAYNLELLGGRLHGDLWFALGWGAFPALTGYFVNAERIAPAGVLIAAGCLVMSVAQRRLSSPARELRRRTRSVEGEQTLADGSVRGALAGGPARAARRRARGDVAGDRADRVCARRGAAVSGACLSIAGQVGAGARSDLARPAGQRDAGANSPSTLPPKPPPISRAPAAPAWSSRSTARLDGRRGDLVAVAQARVGGVQQAADRRQVAGAQGGDRLAHALVLARGRAGPAG